MLFIPYLSKYSQKPLHDFWERFSRPRFDQQMDVISHNTKVFYGKFILFLCSFKDTHEKFPILTGQKNFFPPIYPGSNMIFRSFKKLSVFPHICILHGVRVLLWFFDFFCSIFYFFFALSPNQQILTQKEKQDRDIRTEQFSRIYWNRILGDRAAKLIEPATIPETWCQKIVKDIGDRA